MRGAGIVGEEERGDGEGWGGRAQGQKSWQLVGKILHYLR